MEPNESTLARLRLEAARLREGLVARNTVAGYGYDFRLFRAWCERFDQPSIPATPDTVALYLTDLLERGHKISTARRRKCAIVYEHRSKGFRSPATADVMELLLGAQRIKGEKPRQVEPLTVEQLRRASVLLAQEGTSAAMRNRALLVVGFASALRRSNLAALDLADVEFCGRGVILSIAREKQDQEGKGRLIGLVRGMHASTCPVRVLRAWLRVRGDLPGPLFGCVSKRYRGARLDGETICGIVKAAVAELGLDPAKYGGHSLRSGSVTTLAEANLSALRIAAFTGQSPEIVRRYFRRSEIWRNNAGAALGL